MTPVRTAPDTSQVQPPVVSAVPLTCEQTVRRADDRLGALPASGGPGVEDHLHTCAACDRYLSQLATTMKLLAKRPRPVPRNLRQAIDDAARGVDAPVAESAREAVDEYGPRLLALAGALDDEAAEDVLQATWERAVVEGRDAFTFARLVEIMLGAADSHRAIVSVGGERPSGGEGQLPELDPDADAAELFYPHFYGDGPDAGSWVRPPRSWPAETALLSPEDDLTTSELYGVVDAAIGQLGGARAQLLALVDMGGLDLAKAAELLELDESTAQRALHAARSHLRGAVDEYLQASHP